MLKKNDSGITPVMKIGDRIKRRRKEMNLTRSQTSEKTKLSETSIFFYEDNKRIPRADDLRALAIALNTTASYLIGDIDDPSPDALSRVGADHDNNFIKSNPDALELLHQELAL